MDECPELCGRLGICGPRKFHCTPVESRDAADAVFFKFSRNALFLKYCAGAKIGIDSSKTRHCAISNSGSPHANKISNPSRLGRHRPTQEGRRGEDYVCKHAPEYIPESERAVTIEDAPRRRMDAQGPSKRQRRNDRIHAGAIGQASVHHRRRL
jgi:hypothetical protein